MFKLKLKRALSNEEIRGIESWMRRNRLKVNSMVVDRNCGIEEVRFGQIDWWRQ